jgi:hypothetical protein
MVPDTLTTVAIDKVCYLSIDMNIAFLVSSTQPLRHGSGATDAGMVALKGLTGVRALDLGGTKVTDAGLAELKDARPGIEILR